MVWWHPTLFAAMVCVCASLWTGCGGDPASTVPPPDDSGSACQIDRDCPEGLLCQRSRCVETPPCDGAGCPCRFDDDCLATELCDAPTGICIEVGCQTNMDCQTGQVCAQGACITPQERTDTDGDGVDDDEDNCPTDPNPEQANNDGDTTGDTCDADDDNDTIPDVSDNCPFDANLDQRDLDGDGTGDTCDNDFRGFTLQGHLYHGIPMSNDLTEARIVLEGMSGPPREAAPQTSGDFVFEDLPEPGAYTLSLVWRGWRLAMGSFSFEFPDDTSVLVLEDLEVSPDETPGVIISVRFFPNWIPDDTRHADVSLIGGDLMEVLTVAEDAPARVIDLEPDTYLVQIGREGFSPVVEAAIFDGIEEARVSLEASLEDLADAAMDLRGVALSREDFESLVEEGVGTRGADLSGVIVRGDLSGFGLDLSSVVFVEADLMGANLGGVLMTLADLSDASLREANLSGSQLTGATVARTDLHAADLTGANLDACVFEGADLSEANLSGASLLGARFEDTDLSGATFDDDTICPDGQPQSASPRCGFD